MYVRHWRLMLWAERRKNPITAEEEEEGARECGIVEGVAGISYTMFEGIKFVITDSMLGRARTCEGPGLELWRKLRAEWMGSSTQVVTAKMHRFMKPARCSSVAQLWEALPLWEKLGGGGGGGGSWRTCPRRTFPGNGFARAHPGGYGQYRAGEAGADRL